MRRKNEAIALLLSPLLHTHSRYERKSAMVHRESHVPSCDHDWPPKPPLERLKRYPPGGYTRVMQANAVQHDDAASLWDAMLWVRRHEWGTCGRKRLGGLVVSLRSRGVRRLVFGTCIGPTVGAPQSLGGRYARRSSSLSGRFGSRPALARSVARRSSFLRRSSTSASSLWCLWTMRDKTRAAAVRSPSKARRRS
jgi:hypothetical protein